MPDTQTIYLIIAATFFGFVGLAVLLLYPVYRFMHREDKAGQAWNDRQRQAHLRTPPPHGDGAPKTTTDDEPPYPDEPPLPRWSPPPPR